MKGQNFGIGLGRSARFNLTRLAPILEDVHERLAGVVLGNLDWSDFIDRYDRSSTLFYLDPPYFGSEDDYGKALFGRDQFAAMAERLKRLQGRFILFDKRRSGDPRDVRRIRLSLGSADLFGRRRERDVRAGAHNHNQHG